MFGKIIDVQISANESNVTGKYCEGKKSILWVCSLFLSVFLKKRVYCRIKMFATLISKTQ